MADVVEEVIDDVLDLFPHKPGGMIDRHHQAEAQREALKKEREQEAERIEAPAYKAVKTAQVTGSVIATNVITIPVGGNAMILPLSPYRYRATISIDTAASKVILAKDASAALGGTGFTYATGTPLVITSQAQLWGYNPGAAAITISILAEIYGPEGQ
jgi:hypothetical protein